LAYFLSALFKAGIPGFRSQWSRGLRHGSTGSRLLGLRVRIAAGSMFLCLQWVLCVVR